MSGVKERLRAAADRLDQLRQDSREVPVPLVLGLHCSGVIRGGSTKGPIAGNAFYDGLSEVIVTLGPEVLPLLAQLLRTEAFCIGGDEDHASCTPDMCTTLAHQALADHILKKEEECRPFV